MNKFIDKIIDSTKYISKTTKLYLISFYNKIYFLINKNFTLNKIYKPIIQEKMNKNKNLQQTLKTLHAKNKEVENTILNLKLKNETLQGKISIIQNVLTKRHD